MTLILKQLLFAMSLAEAATKGGVLIILYSLLTPRGDNDLIQLASLRFGVIHLRKSPESGAAWRFGANVADIGASRQDCPTNDIGAEQLCEAGRRHRQARTSAEVGGRDRRWCRAEISQYWSDIPPFADIHADVTTLARLPRVESIPKLRAGFALAAQVFIANDILGLLTVTIASA